MLKYFKQFFLLVALSLPTTACIGPYRDLYKNVKAANKAAVEQRENSEVARNAGEKTQRAAMQAQINSGDQPLAEAAVIKLLVDGYKGSTCNGKNSVEINITTAYNLNDGGAFYYKPRSYLDVFGTFRSIDPKGRKIETYLRGKFYLNGGLLSLQSSKQPTLKGYIEDVTRKKDATSQRMFEMASADKKTMNEFAEKFGSRKLTDDGTLAQPMIALAMDIARDSEGMGWVGSFVADGFDDCDEIKVVGKSRTTTNELPPITANLALRFSTYNSRSNDPFTSKIYWLKAAERGGANEVAFSIAQTYEKMGDKSPRYYPLALQYYRTVADKDNDSRAQSALSHMYKEGLGVAIDMIESQRWTSLAETQRRAAVKICTAPTVRENALSLMKEESRDPSLVLGQVIGAAFGLGSEFGVPVIKSVSLTDLSSINKPFTCSILAQNIGAYITDYTPDFEEWTDNNGNVTYVDRQLEKQIRSNVAQAATNQMQRQYSRALSIEPKSKQDYKITLVPTLMSLSREYSAVIQVK